MNNILMLFLLVVSSAVAAIAQPACERHAEPAGGFSYCPPEGWTSTLDNRKMFQKFSAQRPMIGNFNVRTEASTATLAAYADAGVKDLTTPRPGGPVYSLAGRGSVITESKMRGVRAVFHYTLQGVPIQVISYMFNGKPGTKLVIVCTALQNDTAVPKLCDDMIKTFRLER